MQVGLKDGAGAKVQYSQMSFNLQGNHKKENCELLILTHHGKREDGGREVDRD